MMKTKFLRSGSNPVWVAAFCFKNLKKAQVLDTDIPSCVDQILQGEMDIVSYRVLGYLLLGVVRIYSVKVEYVLHHCDEIIKINKLKISREDIARVETLRMSVTIPERLELDAFELDVLEDANGDNIAPPEEITLKAKEGVFKTEGFELFTQETFEEFDVDESSFSFDHHIEENIRLSQLLMDVEVFQQTSAADLPESRDIPVEEKGNGLDLTPQSKFQGDDSDGRPKRGATTSESMLISTPAVRDRPHFSRKRKVVFDAVVVLPNEVIKKSLRDTRDLVSRRRPHRTVCTVQIESFISSLPNRFYEPLLPCSSELQFVEPLGNLSQSQTVRSPEDIAPTPLRPPQYPGSLEIEGTPRMFDVSESQASTIPKHIATPPTPPYSQRTELQNLDSSDPSSPPESIETEQSLERNKGLNLLDEETNSSGTENSELCENSCKSSFITVSGWSNRTRKVASYLHQSFLHPRKHREEDVVNFSQVLGGRARKECARLFYEVLVLKTTGYVDVEQNEAYGDIAISKLTKLDQTFLFDGLLNDIGR